MGSLSRSLTIRLICLWCRHLHDGYGIRSMPTTLIGLVAEVVDAHDLVSAEIDDFDGNAATKLLDSYAGLGVVDPVGPGSS